jgi:hypothetical protein
MSDNGDSKVDAQDVFFALTGGAVSSTNHLSSAHSEERVHSHSLTSSSEDSTLKSNEDPLLDEVFAAITLPGVGFHNVPKSAEDEENDALAQLDDVLDRQNSLLSDNRFSEEERPPFLSSHTSSRTNSTAEVIVNPVKTNGNQRNEVSLSEVWSLLRKAMSTSSLPIAWQKRKLRRS